MDGWANEAVAIAKDSGPSRQPPERTQPLKLLRL